MTSPGTDRTLRARVLAGETLFGLFLDLGSPLSAEICARAGYDWLVIDLEHGAGTEADLVGLLQSVEVGGSTHVLPLQQPSGQFDGVHVFVATHAPLVHAWPLRHAAHMAPPVPHAP